jgi:ferrochelatase
MRECERQHYRPETHMVRQWYDEPHYQRGMVETIEAELKNFSQPDPTATHLLFSAHGLPRKIVDEGDPYEEHIRATYDAACARLGWPHTTLCYQSRVGPLEWLKPYTEHVVRDLAARSVKQILVYPIAFVSDHIETLYELGMTYANLAREHGVREYRVVPALNDHPLLIEALKTLALDTLKEAHA